MKLSSTQPIAHRVFVLLVGLLLVTSLVAPIATTGVATADDGDDDDEETPTEVNCYDPNQAELAAASLYHTCDWSDDVIDTDGLNGDEAIMHSRAVSEGEAIDAHTVMIDNHLTDTSTIASLEARHAIATAYENGNSSTEAHTAAQQAIRDYYAMHQRNHLEVLHKGHLQYAYIAEEANDDGDISDEFLTASMSPHPDRDDSGVSAVFVGGTETLEVELSNGETHEVEALRAEYDVDDLQDGNHDIVRTSTRPFHPVKETWEYNETADQFEVDETFSTTCGACTNVNPRPAVAHGNIVVMNVGGVDTGGVPTGAVIDHRDWYNTWSEIEQQSDQLVVNYDPAFVNELYDAMDAGIVDPGEVRSAEGQVRHLSGDSDVTSHRFQDAFRASLSMSSPDRTNASSMVVHYNGAIDQERSINETTGDRSIEPTEYVNETYEGLLMVSGDDIPEGGLEVGEPYHTDEFNQTVQLNNFDEGETVTFYDGEFTIEAMYDDGGQEVDDVDWSAPKYDSYDAEEYGAYLDNIADLKDAIEDDHSGGSVIGGGGGWLPSMPDWGTPDSQDALIGVGILVVILALVVVLATNLLDALGP
ncbi:hypothetical protein [Natronobeatus ordinarius]|uniref:hypothetical protein n=1 Tax=Natronobeatus ordinarius TaxID=2963433 RepID=UPI0020CF1974|nr:hypothetical protein [Natronobeatus ordinarius]